MKQTHRGRRRFVRVVGALGTIVSTRVLTACTASGEGSEGATASVPEDPAPTPEGPAQDRRMVAFAHGVASGDPLADRVILWTRVTTAGAEALELTWALSGDPRFERVVASGSAATGPERDFTVKVDAGGLQPGQQYFYRFSHGEQHSPLGCTRTLPEAGAKEVRLAVFSCAHYSAGFFHAYAQAARRTDLDCLVHLGDYLYETLSPGFKVAGAGPRVRASEHARIPVSLADYRALHARQRTDPDLRALHASAPMIAVWDDHEVLNDAWRDGAPTHVDARDGPFAARRAAAIQAFHEWLPTRLPDPANPARLYRSFNFGGLLALHMLDTRLEARDRPNAVQDYATTDGYDVGALLTDAYDPDRRLLGEAQTDWLRQAITGSSARWQVLGQQVLMGRLRLPEPVVRQAISMAAYMALLGRAGDDPSLTSRERALREAPAIPIDLSAWDGYAADRERLFDLMRAQGRDFVVLSGDTHDAWANDLRDAQGEAVGVEFSTPSVTSIGIAGQLPYDDPARLPAALMAFNPALAWAQTGLHGFLLVTATPDEVRAEWSFVSTVTEPDPVVTKSPLLRTRAGQRRIERVGIAAGGAEPPPR